MPLHTASMFHTRYGATHGDAGSGGKRLRAVEGSRKEGPTLLIHQIPGAVGCVVFPIVHPKVLDKEVKLIKQASE
jgi:hypothetical protein